MVNKASLICAHLVIGPAGAFAACEIPTIVEIPEAREARGQESAIQSRTEDYVQRMIGYTDCIKAELAAAGGDQAPSMLQSLLVQRHNAAVAEVQAIIDLFAARIGPIEGSDLSGVATGADR